MVRCGFACRKWITAAKIMLNIDRVTTRNTVEAEFAFKANTDFRRSQCNSGGAQISTVRSGLNPVGSPG